MHHFYQVVSEYNDAREAMKIVCDMNILHMQIKWLIQFFLDNFN